MEDNIFDKVHEVDLKKTMEPPISIMHECHRVSCSARRQRRSEAGTEKDSPLYDRAE